MNEQQLPRHVAIIMDGNGRWAKQHMLKVAMGHRAGVEALRSIIRESSDLGIEALSLFAFSTENWRRSETEVAALMQLLLEYFSSEIDELDENNVRIRILGEKEGLPSPQREALYRAEERTKDNTGLNFQLAINYGSRDEIVRAVKARHGGRQRHRIAREHGVLASHDRTGDLGRVELGAADLDGALQDSLEPVEVARPREGEP